MGSTSIYSRREWIARLLILPAMAGPSRRGAAETTGKISKAAARYQDRPNDGQMCGMCRFYIPPGGRAGSGMMGGYMGPGMMAPGACKLVEGQINPMGWCILYRPLAR